MHEARAVHRLDDRQHVLVAVVPSDTADERPQAVTVRRCRGHLQRRAVLGEEVHIEATSR